MSGTAVPAAIDALVALFGTPAPAGLQVIDGPPRDVSEDFLAIGWTRIDQPSVVGAITHLTGGLTRGFDQFDVSCVMSKWLGDAPYSTVRRQLLATLNDDLAPRVEQHRTLDGAVVEAWISDYALTPYNEEAGSFLDLQFAVHCTAVK